MPLVIPSYPSPSNVYIPTLYGPRGDYAAALIAGVSRNPKSFLLPRYAKNVPTMQEAGYFLRLGLREQGRVFDTAKYIWRHGQPRPQNNDSAESFSAFKYQTTRYNYDYRVPYVQRDQAPWAYEQQSQRNEINRCMTARTYRMCTALTTTTNWTMAAAQDPYLTVDHTKTATALAGGTADAGTTTTPYLKILIDYVSAIIMKDTMGAVTPDMLMMLMNPVTAVQISESPELRDYIKGSPDARNEIRNGSSPNARFGMGLPSKLYGMDVWVENTVVDTALKGSSVESLVWAMPNQNIVFLMKSDASPDTAIEANGVLMNTTAAILFYEDEMTIETFDNPKDRRLEGNVVENCVEVVSSPMMGYLVTSATAAPSANIA